jgi:hypothetical protein
MSLDYAMIENLSEKIKSSYESSVTIEEAEKLAAEFLHAQILLAKELKIRDLDSRMKKSGLKAVKAQSYLDVCSKSDKKPSDSYIQAHVDQDESVVTTQLGFDEAEVSRDELNNFLSIFKDAHIFFRGIAKGRFE